MNHLFLSSAPMEGVVDPIMREHLTALGGLDQMTTEFVRVTHQIIPDHVFLRYSPELKNGGKTASGIPVYVQLLGGDPAWMGENARRAAELGAPGIDLNFGCPAKTVNRHDGGATLLKEPKRVYDVTSAVRVSVPQSTPVTAKVRLGFDEKSKAIEIAQAAEAGGASRLTVHARTKVEMYQPPAHWDYVARIRESVSIPVVANGDIWTPEDLSRCQRVTGCTGFALGRGLVARPTLAREIKGIERTQPQIPQTLNLLSKFCAANAVVSEGLALSRTKQWLKLLIRTFPDLQEMFNRIKTIDSAQQLLAALDANPVRFREENYDETT